MVDQPQRCNVIVAHPKPKLFTGKYFPEDHCGTYGFNHKNSFAIPAQVNPTLPEQPNPNKEKKRIKPFFIVDPTTGLAQPVGTTELKIVETWSQKTAEGIKAGDLQTALETAMQKRYVKAMTLKIRDLIEILIIGGCGAGIALYTLHMIGALTGNPITL